MNARDVMAAWRNGSASDSRSEGCVFKSRRGHKTFSKFKKKPTKPNTILTVLDSSIL